MWFMCAFLDVLWFLLVFPYLLLVSLVVSLPRFFAFLRFFAVCVFFFLRFVSFFLLFLWFFSVFLRCFFGLCLRFLFAIASFIDENVNVIFNYKICAGSKIFLLF